MLWGWVTLWGWGDAVGSIGLLWGRGDAVGSIGLLWGWVTLWGWGDAMGSIGPLWGWVTLWVGVTHVGRCSGASPSLPSTTSLSSSMVRNVATFSWISLSVYLQGKGGTRGGGQRPTAVGRGLGWGVWGSSMGWIWGQPQILG